jgi:rod shape-determining protein MreB
MGQAAKDMVGRVPESIEVVRPLRNGVIAEYEITENLLRFSIQKYADRAVVFRHEF